MNPDIPPDLEAKKAHLDWLYYGIEQQAKDIRLSYGSLRDGVPRFSKWISYLELQQLRPRDIEFLRRVNNRTILLSEVVIDPDREADECEAEYTQRCADIRCELVKAKINFVSYTNGRSVHFHIFCPALKHYKHADDYKKWLIHALTGDGLKYSSNVPIALEGAPHWKTSIKKSVLENLGDGMNHKIPLVSP